MDYSKMKDINIAKLVNGEPISKVFSSNRATQYRHLYIVTSGRKEALLHYSLSEGKICFLSEWYDHIDDFNNFIYTKVYLKEKYNYIFPSGKLVSPFWSDEMEQMRQELWPISFNGEFNFIKQNGELLLDQFTNNVRMEDCNERTFVIYSDYKYYRIFNDGRQQYLGGSYSYIGIPMTNLYLTEKKLTERLILRRRLFSFTIEDIDGEELVSNVQDIIRYNQRPLNNSDGIPEGNQGLLFTTRKELLAGKEELLLSYDFITVKFDDGYKLLCLSTESCLPDIFEEVRLLNDLFVKVKKNGVWNLIDKYGDYLSKDLWYDNIELIGKGNAIVKRGELLNFLKSNGKLLSQEWYDEITPSIDDRYIVRRGGSYNIVDSNLRMSSSKWSDNSDGFPMASQLNSQETKDWSNIRRCDSIYLDQGDNYQECFILSRSGGKLTVLLPNIDKTILETKEVEIPYNYYYGSEPISTSIGNLRLSNPNLNTDSNKINSRLLLQLINQ